MSGRARGDDGSISPFVAVVAIALVMVAGLAYDGGHVVAEQSAARGHAKKAARAGAQAIDIAVLRETGVPGLDKERARAAADGYLARVGAIGTAVVAGSSITVTVTTTYHMRILPGHRTIVVSEAATATDGGPR